MLDSFVSLVVLLFVVQVLVPILIHSVDAAVAVPYPSLDGKIYICSHIFATKFDTPTSDEGGDNRHSLLIEIRGGQEEEDDDGYDDEYDIDADDDDDDDDDTTPPSNRRYDHSMIDPPVDTEDMRHSRSRRRQQEQPSSPKGRRQPLPPSSRSSKRMAKKPKHWTQRMASSGLKMTSQLAWGAVQQTGKVAYHMVKPRHVELHELTGLWRLDQSIVTNNNNGGDMIASVATVELDPRKRVVRLKLPNGETVVEPFTFQKTRLGSWTTEFVSPAFLVGDTPRLYGYRGTWQRKLADKRVIKLVGKIYTVRKQRFGKDKGKYLYAQAVGTFVARRRMKLTNSNHPQSTEDEDDESDDEEEEQEDEEENDSMVDADGDVYDD